MGAEFSGVLVGGRTMSAPTILLQGTEPCFPPHKFQEDSSTHMRIANIIVEISSYILQQFLFCSFTDHSDLSYPCLDRHEFAFE